MRTLLLLIAFLFLLLAPASAQTTFQKTFGGTGSDLGYSIQQTADGGYIITGQTNGFGAGSYDVYLIKTDVNGNALWTKTFGGTNADVGISVQQTMDGGYIITGFTQSFGLGSSDVYLIKTDANGDSLWTKAFGGTGEDAGEFVQQTADGGYIICGLTVSFGAGNSDMYLIKTDANGDSLWTKTYGGAVNDEGIPVQQTIDGGYIIVGSTFSFGAGFSDIYLIKTDANGDSSWTKTFGGTGIDYAESVQQTADSGYIIVGVTSSFGTGSGNVYLIKINGSGISLWTKTFGGTGGDGGYSVQQTIDGGYIITGWTESFGAGNPDVYLIRTDANGDSLWTKTFGGTGHDNGFSVLQTVDGGYIIAGNTYSFGAGSADVYLIKTDDNGNSGCNQGNTATIVSTPATQVTNPATIVSSGGMVTSPATVVGSGGIVNTLCITVGIQEITTDNSFLISPNPSGGLFTISFSENIVKGEIKIYSVLGGNIYSDKINNNSIKDIHLKNISSGIYLIKVFDGKKYYCKKIIIE